MRGICLFVAGIVVALAVQMGFAQSQSRGIVSINHIGLSVPDFDDSLAYYTETLGFPEVFRIENDAGPVLVFLQVSRNTFVELQPARDQQPPGLTHFGVEVEDMDRVLAELNAQGHEIKAPRVDGGVNHTSFLDPAGIPLELVEFAPDSALAQAISHWR